MEAQSDGTRHHDATPPRSLPSPYMLDGRVWVAQGTLEEVLYLPVLPHPLPFEWSNSDTRTGIGMNCRLGRSPAGISSIFNHRGGGGAAFRTDLLLVLHLLSSGKETII